MLPQSGQNKFKLVGYQYLDSDLLFRTIPIFEGVHSWLSFSKCKQFENRTILLSESGNTGFDLTLRKEELGLIQSINCDIYLNLNGKPNSAILVEIAPINFIISERKLRPGITQSFVNIRMEK